MAEVRNKKLILRDYVSGFPKQSDMSVTTDSTIKLKLQQHSKGVLLKNLFLAADPHLRPLMKKSDNFSVLQSFTPGSALFGFGVAKIVDSKHPDFKEGDYVWGITGWEEYTVVTATETLFKIQHTDVPLSYYTGILGMPGLTAYAGFYDVCAPKRGENVFISAAAGAVGQLVGQFAKLAGCYVVGSVGTQDKYTLDEPEGVKNVASIIYKRIRMQGYNVVDYYKEYPKFLEMILPYIREGKIVCVEDIVEGLENGAEALVRVFSGRNIGKQLVSLAIE
ncbi:2-alkenal reductase (NADP(+)-dependent)-like [Senna tora]|uniref:2-alkenal reductase (NADP(+)-dependent)-like n=1 Tax=Senna tora TaxID=362788 RepID=A0A834X7M5_9FABA|nr:2-alkenal reductase (NADP(+)-dependent)-like [Senna tora]